MPSTTVVRGPIDAVKIFQVSLTPSSVPANTTNEQTFTILGVNPGDYLNLASAAAQTAGIIVGNVRITAQNTVAIQFANITGSTATPAAGTYGCVWGSPENLPLETNAF